MMMANTEYVKNEVGKNSIEKAYKETIYSEPSRELMTKRKYMSHGLECPMCHHQAERKYFVVAKGVSNG